ncbi:ammonium transporter [Leptospira sp. 'Mane']|uniref:ammonium transporter n=1 Tax=Leptospira sp. 'Mane' TaxID=3387407 RepID=UPI00398A8178
MKKHFKKIALLLLVVPMFLYADEPAKAADPVAEKLAAIDTLTVGLDTLWVLVAGMLVFFMNAGFALVESGFCQSKNTVNILAKNFIVFAAATFSYWAIGWGLMFGDGSPYLATEGLFFLSGADNSPAIGDAYQGVYSSMNWTGVPLNAKFFFQLVFAATAATIVSGAVAERIKFHSFLIFSFLLVAFIYPFTGHWVWGGGWLAGLGFHDFAGSTVVHSAGGWAALAGALVLGARKGKFLPDGRIKPILGHNMTSAALGTLILWLGWFGFNPGSTMGVGDGSVMSHVIVTTNISAAMGALAATVTAWIILKKPDLGMILNGTLAGLVGITAPCAIVSPASAAIIGAISGALVVVSVLGFDKLKIDDPVGATSVHLVCGIWGTLAVAIFGYEGSPAGVDVPSILTQVYGILAFGGFVFTVSFLLWYVLKLAGGIRVGEEEEVSGLDLGEHGAEAYPDFSNRARG